MILYHATTRENKEKIMREGFKTSNGGWIENEYLGRYFKKNIFGECICFATTTKDTVDHGDTIIKCEINDEYIEDKFIIKNDRYSNNNMENIKYTSKKKSYKAISANWIESNYIEIIVYEPSIIKILN